MMCGFSGSANFNYMYYGTSDISTQLFECEISDKLLPINMNLANPSLLESYIGIVWESIVLVL